MSTDKVSIVEGSKVALHFSLALDGGDILDSNFDKKAAQLVIGDGNMLPSFEEKLLGLRVGDEVDALLAPEQAFGMPNPRNVQSFSIDKFSHILEDELIPTEPGSVVNFKDAGGFDLPGIVKSIDESRVTVDFNHPLAGKSIEFKAKIVSVLPPEISVVEVQV